MSVQIVQVPYSDAEQLASLFHLYVKEMLQYVAATPKDAKPFDEKARLAVYWQDKSHWPYFILIDEEVVGFCLVRRYPREPDTYDMDQFFVLRDHRRSGAGSAAFRQVVAAHPGNWLIRVLARNQSAFRFWQHGVECIAGTEFSCQLQGEEPDQRYYLRFTTVAQ